MGVKSCTCGKWRVLSTLHALSFERSLLLQYCPLPQFIHRIHSSTIATCHSTLYVFSRLSSIATRPILDLVFSLSCPCTHWRSSTSSAAFWAHSINMDAKVSCWSMPSWASFSQQAWEVLRVGCSVSKFPYKCNHVPSGSSYSRQWLRENAVGFVFKQCLSIWLGHLSCESWTPLKRFHLVQFIRPSEVITMQVVLCQD